MSNNLFSIVEIIERKYDINVPDGNELPGKACFNEKLMIEQDETINIDKLNSIRYLYELGNPLNKEELEYVESKIIKFITTDPFEISECFELYNITQNVCNNPRGLSGDLMDILANMINLERDSTLEETFSRYMNVVENRLGKYIPDILKNILDISETYEKNNCEKISENTIMMQKLFSTVIKKNASHENYKMPTAELTGYFDSFQDNIITKIAMLAFLAYIIGKIINTFNVQYKVNPGN
tara:strand:+ start:795 stop:1514 length:720 start_codon:yes stop_codon:yes gene_type:complete